MTANKKMSFEEALAKLEKTSENLKKDEITLEQALKEFESGIQYYNQCDAILKEAKQKVEVYSK